MKTTLHVDLQQLFGTTVVQKMMSIAPSIKMASGQLAHYQDHLDEAILQEFDGLFGFINMLDSRLTRKRIVPLHIEQSDLHIFYVMEARSSLLIHDLQTKNKIEISPLRGRYLYLPQGEYELILPQGRTAICNFYFRCSIFRDGNERPFQFLHPLIAAYRSKDPTSGWSIDFRVGPRTTAHINHLLTKLKKGDLDNEKHILHELHELIKLSNEKVFEEYHKLSASMLKAREARDLIIQYVGQHGQAFSISSLAKEIQISHDYLSEIFQQYYHQSPSAFKYDLLEEKVKSLLLNGMSVVHVAYTCGYTGSSRLCKFFKKRTGLTPSQFISKSKNS
jgi:AraC-like DNA-binding protein